MNKSLSLINFNIEKITTSDLEEIYEIEKRCYPNPWNYQSLKNELNIPFAFHYKFKINSKIAGYCFCFFCSDNLHINNFCIDKKYQNKGNGFIFLINLIMKAKKNGVRTLTLEVDINNSKAVNLYEKAGFKKDKLIRNFYSNGNDAQRMYLNIYGQIQNLSLKPQNL